MKRTEKDLNWISFFNKRAKELLEHETDEVKQRVEEYRKAKYEENAPLQQEMVSIDVGGGTGTDQTGDSTATSSAGSSRRLQLLARQKSVIAVNCRIMY